MKMKDVMAPAVATCQPFDKLFDAASILQREDIGCLPVVTDDGAERVLGLLTDREIAMAAGRERRALSEMYVKSAMAGTVVSRAVNSSLGDILAFMHATSARRLPVVDRDGRLVGLVSLSDITLGVARATETISPWCQAEICRILAMGTRPRKRSASPAGHTAAVDEIMTADVVVARSDETLGTVARRMARTNVPCTPVLAAGSGRRATAMLTDRDICLAAVRWGRPLDEISVGSAVSPVLRSCWPDDSLEAAAAIMRAFGVRRLPVVDASFDLLGFVTLSDLATAFLKKDGSPVDVRQCEQIAETLAAIIRVTGEHSFRGRPGGDLPQRVEI